MLGPRHYLKKLDRNLPERLLSAMKNDQLNPLRLVNMSVCPSAVIDGQYSSSDVFIPLPTLSG